MKNLNYLLKPESILFTELGAGVNGSDRAATPISLLKSNLCTFFSRSEDNELKSSAFLICNSISS